jgi:hypothetical protein
LVVKLITVAFSTVCGEGKLKKDLPSKSKQKISPQQNDELKDEVDELS